MPRVLRGTDDDRLQNGVIGDEFADACVEPRPANHAGLKAEDLQFAAQLDLKVLELASEHDCRQVRRALSANDLIASTSSASTSRAIRPARTRQSRSATVRDMAMFCSINNIVISNCARSFSSVT